MESWAGKRQAKAAGKQAEIGERGEERESSRVRQETEETVLVTFQVDLQITYY